MTAAIVMLGVVVALLAVLVVGLLRSNADVLRTLHELGVGEDDLAGTTRPRPTSRPGAAIAAPTRSGVGGGVHDVVGLDAAGGAVQVGVRGSTGTTLLAFLSSGCTTCHDFWRAFGTRELDLAPGAHTRVVIVTRGPEDDSPFAVAELAPEGVTTVMSTTAWDDYGVPVSPYFILVDGQRGILGEGTATTWAKVVALLERSLGDLGIDLDESARKPTRREVLSGLRHEDHGRRALIEAGIDPEHPDDA